MRRKLGVLVGLTAMLLIGCNDPVDSSSSSFESSSLISSSSQSSVEEDTNKMVTSVKTLENGRTYIDYLGKPFLIIGGQIRVDGLMNRGTGSHAPVPGSPAPLTASEIEPYIKEAKDFGLNTVGIPIDWRDIEPEYDVYNYEVLDTLMSLVNKYDMKMEILWFSTNMCGDTHSFHLPDYLYDESTYPRLKSNYNYFSWMYGLVNHFRLDSEALMEREAKMLTNMMDHIYEWNLANGKKYPVIGVQVHNEADGLVRWRASAEQADLARLNNMSLVELWQMTLNALDNAGKAIKEGKYKVYTRVNMTVSYNMNDFPQAKGCSPLDVLRLEGIDIVGDDPYVESPVTIKDTINAYKKENNYPHIAENMGDYESTSALMLAAFANGGSYTIYDFATPHYFVYMNSYGGSSYRMDQGIVNYDFSYKPHSALTKTLINGVGAASYLFATSDLSKVAAFNISTLKAQDTLNETFNVNGINVTMKTTDGALGYVIIDGEYITLFSTSKATFEFENATLERFCYNGYYDSLGNFTNVDKLYPVGNSFITSGGEVVRIKYK